MKIRVIVIRLTIYDVTYFHQVDIFGGSQDDFLFSFVCWLQVIGKGIKLLILLVNLNFLDFIYSLNQINMIKALIKH